MMNGSFSTGSNGGDAGYDVEQAIMIAFGNSNVDSTLRAQATSYIMNIRNDPNAWRECLSRLAVSGQQAKPVNVRFWYLQVINHFLNRVNGYEDLPSKDRAHVRETILLYIRNTCATDPQPKHLKGILSTSVAALIREDFPEHWPTAFDDLLSLVSLGPQVMEIVLRSLIAVDEDVVDIESQTAMRANAQANAELRQAGHESKDGTGSQPGGGSSTASSPSSASSMSSVPVFVSNKLKDIEATARDIKDGIRSTTMSLIVATMHSIIFLDASAVSSEISVLALKVLSRYIDWIELDLVVSDKFFPNIYSLLGNPQLQFAVLDLLGAIVVKGMPIQRLIGMLRATQMLEIIGTYNFANTDSQGQSTDPNAPPSPFAPSPTASSPTSSSSATELDETTYFPVAVASLINLIGWELTRHLLAHVKPFASQHTAATATAKLAALEAVAQAAGSTTTSAVASPTSAAARARQRNAAAAQSATAAATSTHRTLGEWLSGANEHRDVVVALVGMVERCLNMSYAALAHTHFEVGAALAPFVAGAADFLKVPGSRDAMSANNHFQMLLEAVVQGLLYPQWYQPPPSQTNRCAKYSEHRVTLSKIFRNLVDVDPSATTNYILSALSTTLQQIASVVPHGSVPMTESDIVAALSRCSSDQAIAKSFAIRAKVEREDDDTDVGVTATGRVGRTGSAVGEGRSMIVGESPISQALQVVPYQPIEAALHLFDIYGEAMNVHIMSVLHTDPWSSCLTTLFSSAVSYHPHPLVIEAYMRVISRFSQVFENIPLLPPVICSLLDERGAGHDTSRFIRSRSYHFTNALLEKVKAKTQLRPVLGAILQRIRVLLSSSLRRGPTHSPSLISPEGCRLLCSTMGMLATRAVAGDEASAQYAGSVLETVGTPLVDGFKQLEVWMRTDAQLAVKRYSRLIQCSAAVLRALAHDLSQVTMHVRLLTDTVLNLSLALNGNEEIRDESISYLHALIDTMGEASMQYVGPMVTQLLPSTNASNVVKLLQLINKTLTTKALRPHFAAALVELLGTIAGVVAQCLQEVDRQITEASQAAHDGSAAVAAVSVLVGQRSDIRKTFLAFLVHLFQPECVGVLTHESNSSHVFTILTWLESLITEPGDIDATKTSLSLMRRFVELWCNCNNNVLPESMHTYVGHQITSKIFQVPLFPRFRLEDARCVSILTETISLIKAIEVGIPNYLQTVGQAVIAILSATDNAAMEFVAALSKSMAESKDAYIKIIQHVQAQKKQQEQQAQEQRNLLSS